MCADYLNSQLKIIPKKRDKNELGKELEREADVE